MALIPRTPGPAWNKPFFDAEYEEGMESTLRRIVETQHCAGFTERNTCAGGSPQKLGSHTWIVKKLWTRKGKQHVGLWGWCQSCEAPWEGSEGEGAAGAWRIRGAGDARPLLLTPLRGAHLPALGRSSRTAKHAKAAHMRAWRQAWRREVAPGADPVQGFTHWRGSKAWGWGCFPGRRTMKLVGCSLTPG